jgi:hypothetical protein
MTALTRQDTPVQLDGPPDDWAVLPLTGNAGALAR